MIEAIYTRRSVRRYLPKPISDEALKEIIQAGMWAPSPKNRQPWKFEVVRGRARHDMIRFMKKGIERARLGEGPLGKQQTYIRNAVYTMRIMENAPATVFVFNEDGRSIYRQLTAEEQIHEMSNVQAIGAAMENMALAASDMGIGSLWNGNVFFAYDELKEWLRTDGEMIGAMSFGYPDENPHPMWHKGFESTVIFRDDD